MIRALTLATVLAAGFTLPAFAADAPAATAAVDGNAAASQSAALSVAANAEQARKILLSQGYTNVSELNRDDKGRWTGTATKDGKTIFVAIALPLKAPEAPAAK
jgi:hypothetical protein